jgi:hypothetical protein
LGFSPIREEQQGRFTAFPNLACSALSLFSVHRDLKNFNPALDILKTNPSSALLSGTWDKGQSIMFTVDKITGTNESGCVMTGFTVTPFGSNKVAAQWTDNCGGGNMLLTKQRTP